MNLRTLFSLQYSLRWLMLSVVAVSVVMASWKFYFEEPPWFQIPQYERARSAVGFSTRQGPNVISILTVARNHRDRSITVQNAQGQGVSGPVPHEAWLKQSAPWLDVVQIQLSTEESLLDIIELRVFEHNSRQPIANIDERFSARVISSNLIHLYGFGKALPRELDVWLRIFSYGDQDPVARLAAGLGESTEMLGHTVSIEQFRQGYRGSDSRTGLLPVEGEFHNDCAVLLKLAPSDSLNLQLTTVTKDGRRMFPWRHPHWNAGSDRHASHLEVAQQRIDHFELRPRRDPTHFFFNGLTIPDNAAMVFAPPPVVTIPIDGPLNRRHLPEFDPLQVEVSLMPGRRIMGISSANIVLHPDGPTDLGKVSTLVTYYSGLSVPMIACQVFERGNTIPTPETGFMRNSGTQNGTSVTVTELPIVKIGQLKVFGKRP